MKNTLRFLALFVFMVNMGVLCYLASGAWAFQNFPPQLEWLRITIPCVGIFVYLPLWVVFSKQFGEFILFGLTGEKE